MHPTVFQAVPQEDSKQVEPTDDLTINAELSCEDEEDMPDAPEAASKDKAHSNPTAFRLRRTGKEAVATSGAVVKKDPAFQKSPGATAKKTSK